MCVMYLSRVARAAAGAGIKDVFLAAEMLKRVVEVQSNEAIYCALLDAYGPQKVDNGLKDKVDWLIKSFIEQNYPDEFRRFCDRNSITIFQNGSDADNGFNSNARMVFIVFLREVINLKAPVRIEDDRN